MSSRERPIIFSGDMARAILEGRKTQTRRVIKPQPAPDTVMFAQCASTDDARHGTWIPSRREDLHPRHENGPPLRCPFGQPGDRLYVRETWADVNTGNGPAICYRADGDIQNWRDFSTQFGLDYGVGPSMDYDAYPGDYCMWWTDLLDGAPDHSWRPSIHMPKWAARLWLEVTDVRVERLQDISEEGAFAEGACDTLGKEGCRPNWPYPGAHIPIFEAVWNKLHAKRGHSWENNPWVWVVTFRRVEL